MEMSLEITLQTEFVIIFAEKGVQSVMSFIRYG